MKTCGEPSDVERTFYYTPDKSSALRFAVITVETNIVPIYMYILT